MPLSPNMSMDIPVVGVTPAPDWASLIVSCFNVLDAHDHTPGRGVPIPPGGLDINSDLSFGSNNAIALRAARFTAQVVAIPATGSDLGQIYVAGVDLYYNDGNGNQIRITQSGSVTGSSGTITGLPSGTASAAYSAGSAKFVWQSATNTAADMDFGSAILRNGTVSSFGLTLQPPTLSSNYSITLPALPASQKFMTLDAAGIMSAPWAVDGTTLEISGGTTLQVKAGSIGATQLTAGGLPTAAIADGAITAAKMAASNYQVSSACGTVTSSSTSYALVTNLSVTITTVAGRPVHIQTMGGTTGNNPSITAGTSIATGNMQWDLRRDGTSISRGEIVQSINGIFRTSPSQISYVDTTATAASHTYELYAKSSGGISYTFFDIKLVAWQPQG